MSRRRDHGGIIFIDLRDRSGFVQVVLNPENLSDDDYATAERLRSEWCVQIAGTVQKRPEGSENPALPTGEIEVMANGITVLNQSQTPPFYITDDVEADESLRLRYRYLDLRRPAMQENLRLRHRAVKYIRDYLDDHGFLEIGNAHPHQEHAGGRARLPRTQPYAAGQFLRLAPVAATTQAIADGQRR